MRETGAQEDLQRQRERRREDVLGGKTRQGEDGLTPRKIYPGRVPRAEAVPGCPWENIGPHR